jgi:protein Mpv17
MEGSGNEDIVEALKREYMGIMKANWLVWIPAQLLNFKVVRLKYQVLFTNVVELFWNAYLSFAATGRGDEK